jgi:hypothetical protein
MHNVGKFFFRTYTVFPVRIPHEGRGAREQEDRVCSLDSESLYYSMLRDDSYIFLRTAA